MPNAYFFLYTIMRGPVALFENQQKVQSEENEKLELITDTGAEIGGTINKDGKFICSLILYMFTQKFDSVV